MLALHAKPGASRDAVKPNTIRVIARITTVAKEQDLFVVGRITHGTRVAREVVVVPDFVVLFGPCSKVELGHLLFVFDPTGRQILACVLERQLEELLTLNTLIERNIPPTFSYTLTMLNVWRQMGQLFALSLHSRRHESCSM